MHTSFRTFFLALTVKQKANSFIAQNMALWTLWCKNHEHFVLFWGDNNWRVRTAVNQKTITLLKWFQISCQHNKLPSCTTFHQISFINNKKIQSPRHPLTCTFSDVHKCFYIASPSTKPCVCPSCQSLCSWQTCLNVIFKFRKCYKIRRSQEISTSSSTLSGVTSFARSFLRN